MLTSNIEVSTLFLQADIIMYKQIAFSRIILPSGEVLHREVVVFDEDGKPLRHFPLTEETPFTEWYDKTFFWNENI